MIQSLSRKFNTHIAWSLFLIFYLELISPLYAATQMNVSGFYFPGNPAVKRVVKFSAGPFLAETDAVGKVAIKKIEKTPGKSGLENKSDHFNTARTPTIGGPSSPEATSFKAVGADKLVNLFTGDFSYSIPLLDVGGYPVNLFYSSGIGMDQEASWVGLGWNINPGTVSRNMRGVPDDFNGTDLLTQTQNLKPNRTWGGEVGVDGEIFGIKKPNISFSLGFSYNNYLGPAIDLGASATLSTESFKSEKAASANNNLSLGLGAKLSSRSGLSLSPSLSASHVLSGGKTNFGIGLSTSYNSRTGIKDLTLNSQTSVYSIQDNKKSPDEDGYRSTQSSTTAGIGSSTFSFARPTYMPVLRMPMENSNLSGQVELGGGVFGFRGSVTANGYYSESRVAPELRIVTKPLVGFIYSEQAMGNKDAVMDFSRVNDAEVTPNTPVISAPQYAYDIFSIQGEGTGGSIRAYRGDMGFMRDNVTVSKDKSTSIGVDIAPPGHYGTNWNVISAPTRVGGWEDGNNTLNKTLLFKTNQPGSNFENVYFKNPGEATVANEEVINRIGGDNLVRFQLSGSKVSPRLESALEMYNKKNVFNYLGLKTLPGNTGLLNREKRTQVTTMLTAKEAGEVGLEKNIRTYTGAFDPVDNTIKYDSFPRVSGYRKAHHISEINVLEQTGMRYVYGLPVYSVTQKDFTFSVGNIPADLSENLVAYDSVKEATISSIYMANSSKIDGYVQTQETPAYASSFLLTGLLSPDYVDVTGNGITEDDLGTAVKFDYTKSADLHKWRTPRKNNGSNNNVLANFNEGLRTEKRDNKATISYGEREAWYLNAIESKSMVAIFKTDPRNDAKGVKTAFDGSVNTAENANKKLSRIDLYTKAEIKAKGIANAKPLKSVWFDYGYGLCTGSPDNSNAGEGKLTLRSVYFTYNGQVRNNKERYVFNYGDTTTANSVDDPKYAYNSSDRWGTYKKSTGNPNGLSNINYPYTDTTKSKSDGYAAAWSLKKILFPSGGQMEMQYEADDYAYVQDRRACNMYQIYGLGNSTAFAAGNSLFNGGNATQDNNYVYIRLPKLLVNTDAVKRKKEIFTKYLEGINQLAFKLLVQMPKGPEPLTVYANFDDWDYCSNSNASNEIIYLKLRPVDGKSPLATGAIGFISGNLPWQAFPGYEAEVSSLPDFINLAGDMLGSLSNAFSNVDQQMRDGPGGPKAKNIELASSFIRLNNADRIKCGGGVRVKRVTVKDNWNAMTKQYNSAYGQDYDYTTTEKVDGNDMIISSGVASYEPGIGSEENPFREIETVKNKLPLASAQYGAIEMPVLEGLYPSPSVGYSKVTVRSINRKGTQGTMAVKSAIGKQVTEFFTAREYPSYSVFTPLVPDKSSFDYNKNPFFSFLYKEIINRRTISQGFLVETNDMHGKIKAQAAYSENDEKTPVSASYHTYKNTGKNGLNDKVAFVYNDQGGLVKTGNMGIDMELMTDAREFKLQSNGLNGQLQVDLLFITIFVIPIPTFFPLKTYQENLYRAVTCTKLINYHAIEDSVVLMDKGSIVSTKTIAYDAETGSAIVTRTANEFNDSVFNVSYPAHWAYSGTGLAYKNIGQSFANVNFYDGKITAGVADMSIFESGDELYITTPGGYTQGILSTNCIPASPNTFKLWVFDKNKNTTALTAPVKDLVFIDSAGSPFTKDAVGFRILRSGKRNNLGLTVSSATCMKSPIQNGKLIINNTANVVAASAVEFKEKWQADNDVIIKKTYYTPVCASTELDSIDCNGIVEKKINPYLKGLVGNFKPWRSYTYYGSRVDSVVTNITTIRKNGYISNFINYWGFNIANNLVPDYTNTRWVWNSELTKVNSKGQELETMDALNRYTSAQYGFNKNLPVAITQNARFGEGMNESFEDNNYVEAINKQSVKACTDSRYASFIGLPKSLIVPDTAHTGKYSLRVNSNDSASKFFNVQSNKLDSFFVVTKKDTTKVLNTFGGTINLADVHPFFQADNSGNYTTPQLLWEGKTQFANGGFNVPGIIIRDTFPNGSLQRYHYFKVENSYYIDILQSGSYSFTLGYQKNESCNYTALSLQVNIVNVVTGEATYLSMSNNSSYTYNSVPLCKGIYKVTSIIRNSLVWSLISNPINLPFALYGVFWPYAQPAGCSASLTGILNSWGWYCNNGYPDGGNNSWGYPGISMTTNAANINYKTLSTNNGCIFTKPFAATDSMLNPIFNLVPSKRMLFSAWVKESCTTPCYSTDFTKSKISILSGGVNIAAASVKRTGAIIEGWQKIEGEFTLPANTSTAEVRFVNTNNQPMYVDDIRIHPFNANMKSYVYDPVTFRLAAELDENNYASFYEYDEEGQLVRVKKETVQGIKTIKETRSSKQKKIQDLQ